MTQVWIEEEPNLLKKRGGKPALYNTKLIEINGPKIKPKCIEAKEPYVDVNAYSIQNRNNIEEDINAPKQGQNPQTKSPRYTWELS